MLFNDYPFLLVFLPAAILVYRLADPHPQWRIATLVLLSFVFYSYWNPPFIALLVLSIAINWLAARAYLATKRPVFITGAIVLNLAVLAVFKYANFVADNLGYLLDRPLWHVDIALPLGISFFTFHHIMYLVDLRRGKAPEYPLGRYALYIAFFPQAIAGPLARWSEVMHQFGREVYAPGWQRQFAIGATFIVIGLIEKTGSAIRSGVCSIRSMRRPRKARSPAAIPGWRSASASRCCSISPATRTSPSGWACCSACNCRTISMRRCAPPTCRTSGSAGT